MEGPWRTPPPRNSPFFEVSALCPVPGVSHTRSPRNGKRSPLREALSGGPRRTGIVWETRGSAAGHSGERGGIQHRSSGGSLCGICSRSGAILCGGHMR